MQISEVEVARSEFVLLTGGWKSYPTFRRNHEQTYTIQNGEASQGKVSQNGEGREEQRGRTEQKCEGSQDGSVTEKVSLQAHGGAYRL